MYSQQASAHGCFAEYLTCEMKLKLEFRNHPRYDVKLGTISIATCSTLLYLTEKIFLIQNLSLSFQNCKTLDQ